MDEDKGKGSSTSTKTVSERLEEEVCKAHIIILLHSEFLMNASDSPTVPKTVQVMILKIKVTTFTNLHLCQF